MKQLSVFVVSCAIVIGGLSSCAGVSGIRTASPRSTTPQIVQLPTPKSISPGTIVPPPMALVKSSSLQPGGSRRIRSAIRDPRWTLLTGGATRVAPAGDGSFWVLSPDGPNSSDKYIYHFVNGAWIEISGAATRIAPGFNGTLWAVNSQGGIYHYDGAWTTIAGGAKDIAADVASAASHIFVITNTPGDAGIWEFNGIYSGGWKQLPGGGTTIAADADLHVHGSLTPGPFYVTNSFGEVYKANRAYYGATLDYTKIAPTASRIAPTTNGGLFLLGFPVSPRERPITYYDLDTGTGTQLPGGAAAIDIAADGSTLYAISELFEIWSTPLQLSAPLAPTIGYLPSVATSTIGAQLLDSPRTIVVGVLADFPSFTPFEGPNQAYINESVSGIFAAAKSRWVQSTARATGTRPAADTIHDLKSPDRVSRQTQLPVLFAGVATKEKRRVASLPSALGASANIWVQSYSQRPSHLKAVTAHGAIWLDDSLTILSQAQIDQIGADFELAYATLVRHFGSPNYDSTAPGYQADYQTCTTPYRTDGGSSRYFLTPDNAKIAVEILNPAAGLGGSSDYFSSYDLSPQGVVQCFGKQSNEAPMIYIAYNGSNVAASTAKTDGFELGEHVVAAMARQLEHLINYVHHTVLYPTQGLPQIENSTIDEGLAMLAQDFVISAKYPNLSYDVADNVLQANRFLLDPPSGNILDKTYDFIGFGGSYLFQRYLYDRFGGDAYLSASLDRRKVGQASLESISGESLGQLMVDFGITIAASGTGVTSDPRWTYKNFNARGSYIDQFGAKIVLTGPASIGPLAPGTSVQSKFSGGSMFFYSGPTTMNTILRIQDVLGVPVDLLGGIVQF